MNCTTLLASTYTTTAAIVVVHVKLNNVTGRAKLTIEHKFEYIYFYINYLICSMRYIVHVPCMFFLYYTSLILYFKFAKKTIAQADGSKNS